MRRALLLLFAVPALACAAESPRTVVLVTVDTLRADHTGAFGYDLDTTPALDGLADRGAAFTACVSQQPETGPSLASLLTSRYPREIGVRENGDVLPAEHPLLAEAYAKAGYRTAAFVSTYLLKPHACGLERGFEVYDAEMTSANLGHEKFERCALETVAKAVAWLRKTEGESRFVWVHLYDPHGLYDPGADFAARFFRKTGRPPLDPAAIVRYQKFDDSLDRDDYVARYDGEIRRADDAVATLLGAVGEEAIVCFAADHGEGLGEGGYWFRHGSRLDTAALRVPLVFAGPGVPSGARVDGVVRNLDVAPTLLDLSGLDTLPGARGVSLVPVLEGGAPPGPAFSEARRTGGVEDATGIDTRYKVAVTTAAYRLVFWPTMRVSKLERLAVAGRHDPDPKAESRLRTALVEWMRIGDVVDGTDADPETEAALRALGYIR